jgi:hypothetical protein
MACTANFFFRYPTGGSIQVNCPGGAGVLPGTYGDITTSCRPSRVRARVNGGAWVTSAVGYTQGGGTYYTAWNLANIPGVVCSTTQSNQLIVEVEVTDPVTGAVSWITSNPVNFFAYCMMGPPLMRARVEKTMYLQTSPLYAPSPLWGLVESKLAATQIVTLKLVKRDQKSEKKSAKESDQPAGPEWQSTGSAQGLWKLIAGGKNQAELHLTLPVKVGGKTVYLEQVWGSGNFKPHKGGLFGPVKNVVFLHTLSVSSTKSEAPARKKKRRTRR